MFSVATYVYGNTCPTGCSDASDTIRANNGHCSHLYVLAPTQDDLRYSQDVFGCGISKYVELTGWQGDNTWFAHCCFVDSEDMRGFGAQGVGVAHCPSSNLRLASGIAPVR